MRRNDDIAPTCRFLRGATEIKCGKKQQIWAILHHFHQDSVLKQYIIISKFEVITENPKVFGKMFGKM